MNAKQKLFNLHSFLPSKHYVSISIKEKPKNLKKKVPKIRKKLSLLKQNKNFW